MDKVDPAYDLWYVHTLGHWIHQNNPEKVKLPLA